MKAFQVAGLVSGIGIAALLAAGIYMIILVIRKLKK